jgi:hypothetical protein
VVTVENGATPIRVMLVEDEADLLRRLLKNLAVPAA